jgi:hypothetical protein
MVVDEYIASGSSVKQARKAITNAGYHPKRIEAIQQFLKLPSWYHLDSVKGVSEPNDISMMSRKRIDQLPTDLTVQVKIFIKVLGSAEALRLVTSQPDDKSYTKIPTDNQTIKLKENGLDFTLFISELTQACSKLYLDPELVLNYFISHGGFTALPPDKTVLSCSTQLRNALKYMVDLAFDHKLVKIDDSLDI